MDRTYTVSKVKSQKLKVKSPESRARSGVTLMELLIATSLVVLVGLAVVSVDLGARRFTYSAQQDAGVQNEANPAVEHIINNIKYGWDIDAGQDVNEWKLCARIDDDPSDGIGPFNSDGSSETFDVIRYKYDPTLLPADGAYRQIFFRRDASATDCQITGAGWGGALSTWQQIAKDITACTFTDTDVNGDGVSDRLTINMTAQTTTSSAGTKTITLQSDVELMFSAYKI